MQPVGELRSGEYLIALGVCHGTGIHVPLSGLSGDLLSLGRLNLAYALGQRAVLEVRGDLYRRLFITGRDPSAVPLHPGVEEGRTSDAGDFRVGLTLAPLRLAQSLAAGGRLEVTLPTTNETRGIGTNTTDVRLAALAAYAAGHLQVTGDLGVAILEAPLDAFSQNDVVVYSGELLFRPEGGPLRLSAGLDGRASTRRTVPLGTEDRGEVRLGAEYGSGRWALDLRLGVGYVEASPSWSVGVGAALRGPTGSGRLPRAGRPPAR